MEPYTKASAKPKRRRQRAAADAEPEGASAESTRPASGSRTRKAAKATSSDTAGGRGNFVAWEDNGKGPKGQTGGKGKGKSKGKGKGKCKGKKGLGAEVGQLRRSLMHHDRAYNIVFCGCAGAAYTLEEETKAANAAKAPLPFEAKEKVATALLDALQGELQQLPDGEKVLATLKYAMHPAQLVGFFPHGAAENLEVRVAFRRSFMGGQIAAHLVDRGLCPALWGLGTAVGCYVEGSAEFQVPQGTLDPLQAQALISAATAVVGDISGTNWQDALEAESSLYRCSDQETAEARTQEEEKKEELPEGGREEGIGAEAASQSQEPAALASAGIAESS